MGVRGALIAGLVALSAPTAAAQKADTPPAAPTPRSNVTIIPAPPRGPSFWAEAERVRTVDIPQWAKDAGHNGSATYTATVGADGKLVALKLRVSSRSEAIDAAVKARAETLAYRPATDKDGNPVAGSVNIRMGYARYDRDSPGGGIETYTCGDLVREYDWFNVANDGILTGFAPRTAFHTLGARWRMEQGLPLDEASMDADIEARMEMWPKLLEKCRNHPDRLLLVEIEYPETYRRLVDSY
jgi:TonB family protein